MVNIWNKDKILCIKIDNNKNIDFSDKLYHNSWYIIPVNKISISEECYNLLLNIFNSTFDNKKNTTFLYITKSYIEIGDKKNDMYSNYYEIHIDSLSLENINIQFPSILDFYDIV